MKKSVILSSLNILLAFFVFANVSFASQSSGTIDGTYHYAMICDSNACATPTGNLINFKPTTGGSISAVTIDDVNGIDGNPWGNTIGWLNLGPTGNPLTINPNTGVISGYAWSQVAGWINFAPTGYGVSINGNGEFVGTAWASGENGGWVKFDCTLGVNTCVKTDWRPVPNRTVTTPSGGGGGGGGGSYIIPIQTGTTTTGTTTNNNAYQTTQNGPQNQMNGDYTNLYRSDINDDYIIDLFDFNLLLVNWNRVTKADLTIPKMDRCLKVGRGDINCDGKVDVLDFNILMINWGNKVPRT